MPTITPKTPKDVLMLARDLIADPYNWTQHTSARNAAGAPVLPTAPDACQFCASGALVRALGDDPEGNAAAVINILAGGALRVSGGRDIGIVGLNDRPGAGTHRQVLAAFDYTIANSR